MPLSELISGPRAELLARRRRLWAQHHHGQEAVAVSQHLLAYLHTRDEPLRERHRQAARYQLGQQVRGIVIADRTRQELADTPRPYELKWVAP